MDAVEIADTDRLKVFVSYSRKDESFAQELLAGLEAAGFHPSLDRHDIAAGENWESRLGRLIETADTVVFIISPDSVASQRCAWEVERVLALKKRLLPIIWRSVEERQVPPSLKQLNYIFFNTPHAFGPSLLALSVALKTDLGWIREHTRIGDAAIRWDQRARADALLLRGEELAAAKEWLRAQPKFAIEPTLLMHEYIRAADDAESARNNTERQRLEQMAAAQAEREKAINKAQAALRRMQRAQAVASLALGCIIVGVLGFYNREHLADFANWYWTVRPYSVANVRPYVLSSAAERSLKPGDSFKECASKCPALVVLRPGYFVMGSPDAPPDDMEFPRREIYIRYQFAVAKYATTFADWDECVSTGRCLQKMDGGHGRGDQPVINVSWTEAQDYVRWLADVTGQPYRLLSETEWEYAARAGSMTTYPWGDEIGVGNANCDGCGSNAGGPAKVGSFKPNAFGLYDMHGNVTQWVEDAWHIGGTADAPFDGSVWNGGDLTQRMLRGGSWHEPPDNLRSAARSYSDRETRTDFIGFRVARTLRQP